MSIKIGNKTIAGTPDLSGKQDLLVSGENIKTINNESILGEGNFDVSSIEPLSQEEYDRRKEAGELEEDKYYSTPSDVSLQILQTLYPVGSLYITTNNTCPLASLSIGTWILEATDRVLQGAGSRGAVGTTIDESLPNIKSSVNVMAWNNNSTNLTDGALSGTQTSNYTLATNGGYNYTGPANFNASRSSSTYQDGAPVQQNAYLVNIYRRIS